MKPLCFIPFFVAIALATAAQPFPDYSISDPYLQFRATASSPLYTTYTAAMERSQLYGDKGYKMDYYSSCSPLAFEGDQAGRFFHLFKVNKVLVTSLSEFYRQPVVTASFPDMAVLEYQPWPGIEVKQVYFVYASSLALVDLQIRNTTRASHLIEVYPILDLGNDSLEVTGYDPRFNGLECFHHETHKRLISNLYRHGRYPTHCRNLFGAGRPPYSYGIYKGNMNDFYKEHGVDSGQEEQAMKKLLHWINPTFAFRKNIGKNLLPIGFFANIIDIGNGLGLALSMDGVGTKILIAEKLQKYDTLGIDCIAMNVNDLL